MKLFRLKSLLSASVLQRVFENEAPKWKIDENGVIEVRDGNPVLINSKGEEVTMKADTPTRFSIEAKANRERAEKAEEALKAFEGLDPVAAREALKKLENVDLSKMIEAGQLDAVKAQMTQQFEAEKAALTADRDKVVNQLNRITLDHAFSNSEFVRDRIVVPSDLIVNTFGKNFKVEDGKIVAIGADGNPLLSKKSYGEVASFDEALEIMIDGYSGKDAILKAPNTGGTGSQGDGGNRKASQFVKRSAFEALSPAEQQATAAKAAAGEIQIVDG